MYTEYGWLNLELENNLGLRLKKNVQAMRVHAHTRQLGHYPAYVEPQSKYHLTVGRPRFVTNDDSCSVDSLLQVTVSVLRPTSVDVKAQNTNLRS